MAGGGGVDGGPVVVGAVGVGGGGEEDAGRGGGGGERGGEVDAAFVVGEDFGVGVLDEAVGRFVAEAVAAAVAS